MAVALVAAPVLVARQRLGRAAGRRLPPQPGADRRRGRLSARPPSPPSAAFFRRRPEGFAIAAFAVLPLRVPLEIGGETANLLVPLYLVIAAGRDRLGAAAASPRRRVRRRGPVAASGCAGCSPRRRSSTRSSRRYSVDVPNAIENIGFFLVPFAVLFCLLPRSSGRGSCCAGADRGRRRRRRLRADRDLPVPRPRPVPQPGALRRERAPRLLPGQLDLLRPERLRPLPGAGDRRRSPPASPGAASAATSAAAAVVCAVGLVALAFSYSITSFAALLAGLGMVCLLRWRWRGRRRSPLSALVGAGRARGRRRDADQRHRGRAQHRQRARRPDQGRPRPVRGDRPDADARDQDVGKPIAGYGSGSFGRAFFEHIEQARTTVSHSEPVTVAAEQGVIGLVALRRAAGLSRSRPCSGSGAGRSLARTAVAACFVAMLVDSFGYTGFVIDPATWALLGLGIVARRRSARRSRRPIPGSSVRIPPPAGDHGRRVHGLERPLEADRGLPAAGLHGGPDARPTTAPPR